MCAAFIRSDGTFGGLHMTWLNGTDVPTKAEILDPDSGEVLNSRRRCAAPRGRTIIAARL
jgi:hypothetical protein